MARTSGALREKPSPSASAITQWKQAVEQLKESEERYRSVIELAPDGIVTINLRGIVTSCNTAFATLSGFSRDEIVGKHILELPVTPAIHAARYAKLLSSVIRGKTRKPFEFEWVHRDGSLRWGECHVSLMRIDNKVVGIQAIGRDITERKQAEEAIREAERRYRAIFENRLIMVFVNNEKGLFLDANDAALARLGYTRKAIGKLSFQDIVHPEDLTGVIGGMYDVMDKGYMESPAELRVIGASGEVVWVEVFGVPLHRSAEHYVGLGIALDITERKLAEEELAKYRHHLEELVEERTTELRVVNKQLQEEIRERKRVEEAVRAKEEYFRALMENSQDAMIVLNGDGSMRDVSTSIESVTGYKVRDLKAVKPFEFVHRDDLANVTELFLQLVQNPGAIERRELCYRHKDGSWHHAEAIGQNLLDDPTVGGIVVNFRDVTERKQAQEKLEKLYKKEMKLRQQLEEEMKKRVEFTRALAHELKTPLTPVVMSSELLTSELKDETLLKVAQNISRGASNLNSRIDELLDLARGEIGMLQVKPEEVDVLQLLREVVEDVAPMTSSRGQSLISKLPSSLPLAWCDKVRLRQIMLNLLNNAFKFTPEGGQITLRARQEDANLIVEIHDTGPGIAGEEQQQLFEPYHRVDSDRERLSGLGLGLALCKTLVEIHGGRIWVKSHAGKGSTFSFSLPLKGHSH